MKQDEKVAIALNYGYTEEDAETWYAKYSIHQRNARVRGLESELSFEQYLSKAVQAGIDAPDGIGTNTGQFVLGRVGDVGNYTVDSCRFITTTQNLQEATENGRRAIAGPKIAATKIGRTKENHPGTASQADKLAKEFVLVDPTGVEHRGKNLKEFCDQRDLEARALYSVFAGRRSHHKGWTGKYVQSTEQ
jgi:hypothetical protein